MPSPDRSDLTRDRWVILAAETVLCLICLAFIVALAFVAILGYHADIFTSGLYTLGSAAMIAEAVKRVRNLYQSERHDGQ